MAFTVVMMLTVLALLATVMQGRKLERDALPRATCTAPVATKDETAVVTCHYPLDVEQPGEIVSITVERYPLISSSTGFPSYVLECMWNEDFTCTSDVEEHRVEGKKVVITIKNVTEDSQGRYLCKMMVKDGANVHGDPCQLLVNDASQRATCTAPVVTKGETAVVTCHYPLDVKQPGEIVSVTVERYPFISSRTVSGSLGSDHILDCMWNEDFTCTLDEEEHRVEGKEVVITIRNVNEDSQGRYLCMMMVKDGPIIHGESCPLLVNDTSSGAQMEAWTIPINVAVCALVLVIVAGVAVVVWKKRGNGARQRGTAENGEMDVVKMHEVLHHDCTERSLGSGKDPYKGTVKEKVQLIEEKERNETASSHPQYRPPTRELKREKDTEIEENQKDAKKKEDEENEMETREEKKEDEEEDEEEEEKEEEENEAKVTDEQKQVEEKKEDEENEEDKEETDKENEEDEEEEEQKEETRCLLGDQSLTQNVDNTADPKPLEM